MLKYFLRSRFSHCKSIICISHSAGTVSTLLWSGIETASVMASYFVCFENGNLILVEETELFHYSLASGGFSFLRIGKCVTLFDHFAILIIEPSSWMLSFCHFIDKLIYSLLDGDQFICVLCDGSAKYKCTSSHDHNAEEKFPFPFHKKCCAEFKLYMHLIIRL
jgi:hypothetical protein